jgi:uncharacterized protein
MGLPQRADMPTWECYELVNACSVGRLCFLDGDTPITYPVSFKLHRTDAASAAHIVIRTGPGSLIAKYAGPASFEVDEIDVESRSAWSVLLRGEVRRSYENDDLPIPDPWLTDDRNAWLLFEVSTLSGRRFVAKEGPDGFSVEWQLDTLDESPGG